MSISDPANLFERVPELRSLSDDPRISRAIESGDPFKVYRALVLARLFRRLPQHQALLKELTKERRLFAKSLKGTPSLGTYNSVGFSFVGESERDTDGSHIALHAFVILFGIPLVPMGSYLVKSTGSNQWQIYARAPLGLMGWLYTRGLALALVIMVLTGAAHSYHESSNQDLIVLNGFEFPASVQFGDKVISVPPQGRVTVNLPTGQLHGVASMGKAGVIDTLDIKLESLDRHEIWNLAGAAPLVQNTITYYKVKPVNPDDGGGSQNVYCGKNYLAFSGIKYLFTETPQTISMSKYQTTANVVQLAVISQPNISGVKSCSQYAFEHDQGKDMAKALEAVAALNDWNEEDSNYALYAARSNSVAEAIRVARRIVKAKPDATRMERALQHLREDAGEHELMLTEYANRARQEPDSGSAQYLYASLLSGTEGVRKMAELAQKFPQDADVLRSLVWRKGIHGDYSGASRDLSKLHQLSPADAAHLFDLEIRLLVLQGKPKDALKLLDAAINDQQASGRGRHAVEFGQISRQLGGDAEKYLRSVPDNGSAGSDKSLDAFRVRAGLAVRKQDNASMPIIQLSQSLRTGPEQALKLVRQIDTNQISQLLGSDQIALIYGEAVRVDNKPAQAKLRDLLQMGKKDLALFDQYLRGEKVNIDDIDVESDTMASAYLIRSRNAQLAPQERNSLRQLAIKADVMQGIVTTASKQWQS